MIELLMNDVVVGREYVWDIGGLFSRLHPGTSSVRVVMKPDDEIVDLVSVQTGELFSANVDWIQPPVEEMRRKYKNIINYSKKTGRDRNIISVSKDYFQGLNSPCKREMVLLGRKENLYTFLKSNGRITQLHMSWFPGHEHLIDREIEARLEAESKAWDYDYDYDAI